MIEITARAGCGYEFVCPLAERCGRNKEVVVARVPANLGILTISAKRKWETANESSCTDSRNPLFGQPVVIQHYRVYSAREVADA